MFLTTKNYYKKKQNFSLTGSLSKFNKRPYCNQSNQRNGTAFTKNVSKKINKLDNNNSRRSRNFGNWPFLLIEKSNFVY